MIILHVTDLHLNKRWFEWLLGCLTYHDLLCISGDLLDHNDPAPNARQVARVSEWLKLIDRPLCLCSGNHDLEWDSQLECWRPARWLQEKTGLRMWSDGDTFDYRGRRIHCISCTTYPKGSPADIWVVHAPPTGVAVGRDASGIERGDPDLTRAIVRHRPRVVLCGHVHEPASWFERRDGVIYLNPGSTPGGRFPNHILFDTESLVARRIVDTAIGACCEEARWSIPSFERPEDLVHA